MSPMPRVVMTLLVRNEEDIVLDQLRLHFALGVSAAIVMDNGSTDSTGEILREFARDHEVHLLHQPSDRYEQSSWVTEMARMAVSLGADWVINTDADEFHWPRYGTLPEVFAAVPDRFEVLEMPVSHFVPRPNDGRPWHRRLRLRETRSVKPSGRAQALNVAHRAGDDVTVHPGNHGVSGSRCRVASGWHPITVLHFPLRSFEQYELKIASAGPAFTGGYNFVVPGEKDEGIWSIFSSGRLAESYEAKLVDDEKAAGLLKEGRVVYDGRLSEWLDGQGSLPSSPPPLGGALAWPEEPPAIAELRVDCARRVRLAGHEARFAEQLDIYEQRIHKLTNDIARRTEQNRELKQRLKDAQDSHEQLVRKLKNDVARRTEQNRTLKQCVRELQARADEEGSA